MINNLLINSHLYKQMSRNVERRRKEIQGRSRPESYNSANFRLVKIKNCELRLLRISSLIKKFKKH